MAASPRRRRQPRSHKVRRATGPRMPGARVSRLMSRNPRRRSVGLPATTVSGFGPMPSAARSEPARRQRVPPAALATRPICTYPNAEHWDEAVTTESPSTTDGIDGRNAHDSAEASGQRKRERTILHHLRLISSRLDDEADALFRQADLDSETFAALEALWRHGPSHQLDLAQLDQASRPKSGGLLDRLERLAARGSVARVAGDRPTYSLTADGRALVERITSRLAAFKPRLFATCTDAELTQLDTTLGNIVAAIDTSAEQPNSHG